MEVDDQPDVIPLDNGHQNGESKMDDEHDEKICRKEKKIEKVTDEDGSEFIITINEIDDGESEVECVDDRANNDTGNEASKDSPSGGILDNSKETRVLNDKQKSENPSGNKVDTDISVHKVNDIKDSKENKKMHLVNDTEKMNGDVIEIDPQDSDTKSPEIKSENSIRKMEVKKNSDLSSQKETFNSKNESVSPSNVKISSVVTSVPTSVPVTTSCKVLSQQPVVAMNYQIPQAVPAISLVGGNLLQQSTALRMVIPTVPPVPNNVVPVSQSLYQLYLHPRAQSIINSATVNTTPVQHLGGQVGTIFYPTSQSSSSVISSRITTGQMPRMSQINVHGQSRSPVVSDMLSSGQKRGNVVTLSSATTGNVAKAPPTKQGKATPVELKTPESSWEMIEMVRWESSQRNHNRPKNTKYRPDMELSNLAKFLRDLGQDLVKETVYSDLVRIQQRRNTEGKLGKKEAKDFFKLKSVHTDLKQKIGPVKVFLKKRCKCGFRTESENVLYCHKQYPHVDGYDLTCCYCDFATRLPMAFQFHMESEHDMKGKEYNPRQFWECSLCPYEHNMKNKLTQHKFKCIKNFKLHLNLHPTWLPGPETNYCLENIFYKPMTTVRVEPPVQPNVKIMPKFQQPSQQVKQPVKTNQFISKVAAPVSKMSMPTYASKNPAMLSRLASPRPATQRPTILQLPGQRQTFTPNVNPFAARNSAVQPRVTYIHPNNNKSVPASTSVSTKINHLITMNDQVLDLAAKGRPNSAFEICEICGGYVKDRTALRIHFFYAHRIDMPHGVFDRLHPPLYCATCFARFWTAQGLQKHLEVHKEDSSGGVAGKCVVCGHRVPNILMHMKIVHNKALNNFLKDCKCIFCGTTFNSKVVVENHMAAVHGVVVKSSSPQTSKKETVKKPTPTPTPTNSENQLVKGSVCVLCNLNFGRNVDLTRHCMRIHHTCMKCGMVVADKESLLKHACLESSAGLQDCEICGEKGFHPAYHVKHIRDKHLKKCSVKLRRLSWKTIESYRRKEAKKEQGQVDGERNKRKMEASDLYQSAKKLRTTDFSDEHNDEMEIGGKGLDGKLKTEIKETFGKAVVPKNTEDPVDHAQDVEMMDDDVESSISAEGKNSENDAKIKKSEGPDGDKNADSDSICTRPDS